MDTSFKQLFNDHALEICAYDFGYHPAINQATINLAEQEKINAAAVLIDAPHLDLEFVEKAIMLKHEKKLSIGLQLNFQEYFNGHQDQELVRPTRTLYNPFLLFSSLAQGRKKELKQRIFFEIERQFYYFEEIFDCWPDFITSTDQVHMLPIFVQALREFYEEHRLDHHKIWVQSVNRVLPLNKTSLPGNANWRAWAIRLFTKKARSSVYSWRKELLGIYSRDCTEEEYNNLFKYWLEKATQYSKTTGRGAVIMVHPCLDPSSLKSHVSTQESDQTISSSANEVPQLKSRVMEYTYLSQLQLK